MILHERKYCGINAEKRLEIENTPGDGFRLKATYTTENGTTSVEFVLSKDDLFIIAARLNGACEFTRRKIEIPNDGR